MPIKFSVVSDDGGFLRLEQEWRALSDALDASHFFQTFDWCWHAWRCVASPLGRRLRILVGRVDGVVVLIWPLMIAGPFLRALGTDLFEFHDLLVRPDPRRDVWFAAALRALRRLGAAALLLRDINPDADVAGLLSRDRPDVLSRKAKTRRMIQLHRYPTFERYLLMLPASVRRDHRRRWRRASELPDPACFEVLTDENTQREAIRWMHAQKTAWLERRGDTGGGIYSSRIYLNFLETIVAELHRRDMVLAMRLVSGGDTLSVLLGFRFRDHFVFFMFAYDRKWQRFAPGLQIMAKGIEWNIEHGMHVFDMLYGEEEYKSKWGDDEQPVKDYLLPLTWQGHGLVAWHRHGLRRRLPRPLVMAAERLLPRRIYNAIRDRLQSHSALIAELRPGH